MSFGSEILLLLLLLGGVISKFHIISFSFLSMNTAASTSFYCCFCCGGPPRKPKVSNLWHRFMAVPPIVGRPSDFGEGAILWFWGHPTPPNTKIFLAPDGPGTPKIGFLVCFS